MSLLGPDGHPTRGGFLPPVPLPRRMWAGGELEFLDSLRVGDEATRASRIADVTVKTGSTGTLCFVSVEHLVTTPRGTAIRERQDIVYRDVSGTPRPAETAAHRPPRSIAKAASPIRCAVSLLGADLQRSASIPIRDYVTKVEDYPGLIFPARCRLGYGRTGGEAARRRRGEVRLSRAAAAV